MDAERILSRLVQVGTVTDIDNTKHLARVKFKDTGITSGWLFVLNNHPHTIEFDHALQRTDASSGESGDAVYESHMHTLTIERWMPRVNDTVVCLYLPVWNSDGFVIGGIT